MAPDSPLHGVIPVEEIPVLQGFQPQGAPEAQPGKPLTGSEKGTQTIRCAYPIDEFDSGVAGVGRITSAGTEIGPSKLADIVEAAARADINLEVVEPVEATPVDAGPTKEDLQAEADRRNLTVEGTGKDGNVTKADLEKALAEAESTEGQD